MRMGADCCLPNLLMWLVGPCLSIYQGGEIPMGADCLQYYRCGSQVCAGALHGAAALSCRPWLGCAHQVGQPWPRACHMGGPRLLPIPSLTYAPQDMIHAGSSNKLHPLL